MSKKKTSGEIAQLIMDRHTGTLRAAADLAIRTGKTHQLLLDYRAQMKPDGSHRKTWGDAVTDALIQYFGPQP